MSKNEILLVGKIVGTRGLSGELKVEYFTDTPEDFFSIKRIFSDPNTLPLKIISLRIYKSHILMKLSGVDNKESAEMWRGKSLYAYRDDINLKENRYFIEDLKGCKVIDFKNKKEYGFLRDIINTGANDIYIIKSSDSKEYLVPIIEGTVKDIDLENDEIYINPLRGIFDDN